MTTWLLVLSALEIALPAALLGWLAFRHPRNGLSYVLGIALAGTCIAVLALAGVWLVVPYALAWAYPALFAAAVLASWRRRPAPRFPSGPREWLGSLLLAAPAAVGLVLCAQTLAGRMQPAGEVVDLASPFESGTWYVAHGGSRPLINGHLSILKRERARAYHGQAHAVDLVRVNALSVRAPGLLPRDPAVYATFGEPIVAPCDGRVVAAADGLPDLPVPDVDRVNFAGNHVILECGGVWVLLAHLRNGSVRVVAGQDLRTGERLGEAGNSGNTGEPHLHVHVQTPGTADAPLGGKALPIRIGGRYLYRNARLAAR